MSPDLCSKCRMSGTERGFASTPEITWVCIVFVIYHCSIWVWIVVVILAYGDSLLGGTNQLLPHPGHEIIFTFLLHTMLYESYVCLLVYKTIFI